jgi:hypothetical protein
MQELRLVAVSEDGSYLVLATAGRGTRFTLPVDDRLRAAVRGHFSRLGQFEIEVESPLRPKEIQARIRAGETAEEIAESAGIPVERVRWFEGPVLQEREYMAQQAQRVAVRRPGESSPGPPLGEMVEERLGRRGIDLEDVEWDSWKCEDSTWRVRLSFFDDGRPYTAEWRFDPRRRLVSPLDEEAAHLCSLVLEEPAADTVTPLVPRRPAMKVVSDSRGAAPEARQERGHRDYIVEHGRMVGQPEPVAPPAAETDTAPEPREEPAESRARFTERRAEPAPEPREEPAAQEARAPAAEEPQAAEPETPAQRPAANGRREEAREPVREPADERESRQADEQRRRQADEDHRRPGEQERRQTGESAREQVREAAEPRPGKAPEPRKETAQPRRETAAETRKDRPPKPAPGQERPRRQTPAERAPERVTEEPAAQVKEPAAVSAEPPPAAPATPPARPRRKSARGKRASVPSWDEIMFGARRPD